MYHGTKAGLRCSGSAIGLGPACLCCLAVLPSTFQNVIGTLTSVSSNCVEGEALVSSFGVISQMQNFNLSDRFPPIQSQRGLLSCAPIAFCDAVWWEIQRGRVPGVKADFKPSVQFVYYNARKREGEQNSNAPVPPSTVMEALKEWGVCDVELWPDETRLYRERPPTEAYDEAVRMKDWRFEEVPQTLEGIRGCLKSETPFFFCLRFCSSNSWSFEGGEISRTGILTLPESNETPFRNHAMLAVGLDEETERVQARNSYGPDWGSQGHVFIPLKYLLSRELGYALWKLVPPPHEK